MDWGSALERQQGTYAWGINTISPDCPAGHETVTRPQILTKDFHLLLIKIVPFRNPELAATGQLFSKYYSCWYLPLILSGYKSVVKHSSYSKHGTV